MRRIAAAVLLVAALVLVGAPARAQDESSTTTQPSTQVPTQDIVPEPNSGAEPTEAGDRGGALQLLMPVLIVAAIGGGVWHLSRQARRNQV